MKQFLKQIHTDHNFNKFNIKIGDTCILDQLFRNRSKVKILAFTPNQLYATIVPVEYLTDGKWDEDKYWDVMTNRLTPVE